MRIISAYANLPGEKLKHGESNFYGRCAYYLKENSDNHVSVKKFPDVDNWVAGTHIKPGHIRDKLVDFEEAVLWVDVDSVLHKKIPELDFNADIAVAYRPSPFIKPHHKSRLYAPIAVLWFNYSAGSFYFLWEWIKQCKENPTLPAHESFAKSWENLVLTQKITIEYLPETYSADPFKGPKDAIIEYRGSGHL